MVTFQVTRLHRPPKLVQAIQFDLCQSNHLPMVATSFNTPLPPPRPAQDTQLFPNLEYRRCMLPHSRITGLRPAQGIQPESITIESALGHLPGVFIPALSPVVALRRPLSGAIPPAVLHSTRLSGPL